MIRTLAIDHQLPMKDARNGTERRPRQRMTEDDHPVVARLIVLGCDGAAEFGRNLEGSKEIAIDTRYADTVRSSLSGEIGDGLIKGGNALEGTLWRLMS